jgi:hypothetical protein
MDRPSKLPASAFSDWIAIAREAMADVTLAQVRGEEKGIEEWNKERGNRDWELAKDFKWVDEHWCSFSSAVQTFAERNKGYGPTLAVADGRNRPYYEDGRSGTATQWPSESRGPCRHLNRERSKQWTRCSDCEIIWDGSNSWMRSNAVEHIASAFDVPSHIVGTTRRVPSPAPLPPPKSDPGCGNFGNKC